MSEETQKERYERIVGRYHEYDPEDAPMVADEAIGLLNDLFHPSWIERRKPGEPRTWMKLRAGMVVRVDDGREILIGDVNEEGGSCSCCDYLIPHDVVAWRWVSPEYASKPSVITREKK